MTPFEEQIIKESETFVNLLIVDGDTRTSREAFRIFLFDALKRQRTALLAEIDRRRLVNHLDMQWREGYNQALTDLTAFLTGRISVQTPQ